MQQQHRIGRSKRLGLAVLAALATPWAAAQDSGVGVDLHFGNALDPSGMAHQACDSLGLSWLTAERKRSPSGNLYPCPPAHDPSRAVGDAGWRFQGSLALGYIDINDENNSNWLRFNRWTDGIIGRLDLHYRHPADGRYLDIRGSHINGDNQFYTLTYARAGHYRVEAYARSQPNVTSGSARSIWDGVGSNQLTLKPGLTPGGSSIEQVAAVSAALPGQILQVVRDKQGVGLNYLFNRRLSVYANASHEQRQGARAFGGPFFFAYIFPGAGGVYETPRPIDDSTVNFNGGLRYVGNRWNYDVGYSGSFFRSRHRQFDYEIPFRHAPLVPGFSNVPLSSGQFAYEPENDYHNLRFGATRKLDGHGQFSLNASFSSSRQNDELLAPMHCNGQFGLTVAPFLFDCADWNTTAALSRRNADLRIDSSLLNARLVLQPRSDLTVQSNVKYHRQDYKGSYLAYNPLTGQYGYIAENGAQGGSVPFEMGVWAPGAYASVVTRVRNLPLDKEIMEAGASADWRVNRKNTLGLALTHTRTDRSNREVERQDDTLVKLSWSSRALDNLTLRSNYSYLHRKGRDYNFDPYEFSYSNSLPGFVDPGDLAPHTIDALRKYDVGGRKQHKATLIASLALPRAMTLAGTLRGDWNEYDAEFGRQRYDSQGASLQWDWQPSERGSANLFLGYDRSHLGMANINELAAFGSEAALGGDTYLQANRWWVDDAQRNYYAGAQLSRDFARGRLEAGWDYSDARGITEYRFNSPGALAYPALAAIAGNGFAPMLHRVNTFRLSWSMPLGKRVGLRLFDTYETGRLADWHYFGLEQSLVTNNRVYLDSGPGNYSVNLIGMLLEVPL